MPSQNHYRIWIGRANVEELDVVIASCCEVSFIRRYAEAVDLRIGMLNCAVADARESLPESNGVVIASYRQMLVLSLESYCCWQ